MQKKHLDSNEALAEDHAESNGRLLKNQQDPVNIIRKKIYIESIYGIYGIYSIYSIFSIYNMYNIFRYIYIHAEAAQNASESNETLIRNHQDLMQSEGHQTFTDFH